MGHQKVGPETSHEERARRRLHIVYTRQTRERQIYMQELKEIRRRRMNLIMKNIKEAIGPPWYQALSVLQRDALNTLEHCIYQDLLQEWPTRTANLMRRIGLYPRPSNVELMECIYAGRDDPKQMLASLFFITFGHPFSMKRKSYPLNARIMLSAILYLGFDNLLVALKKKFEPDVVEEPPRVKPKPKPKAPLESPYLQELVAVLYSPPKRKPFQPSPLPDLEEYNEPYVEDPPYQKPPTPPPPPPPPKKRLPRSYCDQLAGVMRIEPYSSVTALTVNTVTRTSHKRKKSKMFVSEFKKTYGINVARPKTQARRKKIRVPNTGIPNAQYVISGVYNVNGKMVFVLGSVAILPPDGELIHGGFKCIDGGVVNIHCGFRGTTQPPKPETCDCVKKWQDSVFKYIKSNKCHCRHFYDYGNDGTFARDELPFFEKPTNYLPFKFNYDTIYDLDEKHLHVKKEFHKIWETESALHLGDDNFEKKDKKKKKVKKSSKTCFSMKAKPEDYLRCVLRYMRVNIAAKLPDVHLVPELKEWMRRRIYGPVTPLEKKEMMHKSTVYWQFFITLAQNGSYHKSPRRDPLYSGLTTWAHKQKLHNSFLKYTEQYKQELFQSYAKITNMFWPTMFQAQFPDKTFRETYFSYLYGRVEDLTLMHPFDLKETIARKFIMLNKRCVCLPAGIEDLDLGK